MTSDSAHALSGSGGIGAAVTGAVVDATGGMR
jgi:hypothetical protein